LRSNSGALHPNSLLCGPAIFFSREQVFILRKLLSHGRLRSFNVQSAAQHVNQMPVMCADLHGRAHRVGPDVAVVFDVPAHGRGGDQVDVGAVLSARREIRPPSASLSQNRDLQLGPRSITLKEIASAPGPERTHGPVRAGRQAGGGALTALAYQPPKT